MRYLFLLFLFVAVSVFGQTPQVPSVMDFAGMKLHLNNEARRQIQTDVDNLRRSETYFRNKLQKVDLYFPIIEKIFKEENLPEDFKYLVIQESALVPDAVSSSNAVGFWQFKKETATEMGLRVDHEVDERQNIVASSRAAARYLKKNNFYFNNWIYALLAYNTGRGGAEKYIRERDFGKKKMDITGNTHWYVKKFLAHKIAFENELGKSKGPFFLYEYTAGNGKSLKDITREFEADYDLVLEYNKCFKRKRIPDDKNYCVIIPIGFDQTDLIAKRNDGVYDTNGSNRDSGSSIFSVNRNGSPVKKYYSQADQFPDIERKDNADIFSINGKDGIIAKPGDSFDMLALKGGISTEDFYKYNDLTNFDRVKAGEVYYFQKKQNKAKTHYHTLMPGQTLWEVSQKYGIKLKKLLSKNRLKDESEAKAGLVLWLRYIRPRNVPPEYHDIRHFEEEEKEEVTKQDVVEKAPVAEAELPKKTYLVGDDEADEESDSIYFEDDVEQSSTTSSGTSALPAPENNEAPIQSKIEEAKPLAAKPAVVSGAEKKHVVQKGETLYSISRMYEIPVADLLAWNGLHSNDVISIGQELVVKAPSETTNDQQNSTAATEKSNLIVHVVTDNDTLYGIAKKYQVTIKDIMEWNAKEDFVIKAGEELKIYQ